MNLNLFNDRKIDNNFSNKNNDFVNAFIEELKNALKNIMNEGRSMSEEKNTSKENNVLEEYNLYEKRKIFLDNKSWKGNDFAWIMDDKLSEHGDGGPYGIDELDLPENVKVGEVYEKINGEYVYNAEVTEEINKI